MPVATIPQAKQVAGFRWRPTLHAQSFQLFEVRHEMLTTIAPGGPWVLLPALEQNMRHVVTLDGHIKKHMAIYIYIDICETEL